MCLDVWALCAFALRFHANSPITAFAFDISQDTNVSAVEVTTPAEGESVHVTCMNNNNNTGELYIYPGLTQCARMVYMKQVAKLLGGLACGFGGWRPSPSVRRACGAPTWAVVHVAECMDGAGRGRGALA